jgi:hypothetical protein
MRLMMALMLCVTTVAGITGCYIVESDKPANSAAPATTAAATATATVTQPTLRSAPPPPPLPDGG